jgi:hypothetical protein
MANAFSIKPQFLEGCAFSDSGPHNKPTSMTTHFIIDCLVSKQREIARRELESDDMKEDGGGKSLLGFCLARMHRNSIKAHLFAFKQHHLSPPPDFSRDRNGSLA